MKINRVSSFEEAFIEVRERGADAALWAEMSPKPYLDFGACLQLLSAKTDTDEQGIRERATVDLLQKNPHVEWHFSFVIRCANPKIAERCKQVLSLERLRVTGGGEEVTLEGAPTCELCRQPLTKRPDQEIQEFLKYLSSVLEQNATIILEKLSQA